MNIQYSLYTFIWKFKLIFPSEISLTSLMSDIILVHVKVKCKNECSDTWFNHNWKNSTDTAPCVKFANDATPSTLFLYTRRHKLGEPFMKER